MYPKPYIQYLVYFHGNRDYFECHEVLEEYWKEKPTPEREHHWVGLIQLAVSLYHYRRKNMVGAMRMIKSALVIIQKEEAAIHRLGLDVTQLVPSLQQTFLAMEVGTPYKSINLPIWDETLALRCIQLCTIHQFTWQTEDPEDSFLLHKHTLRDRSDIIATRKQQMKKRQR